MKNFFLAALALLALAPFSFEAKAQTVVNNPSFVNPCTRQTAPSTGCILVDAANPLPVAATITPSGTQNVNITQVGGNAVTTTVPVSDGGGSLTVDGAVTATGNVAANATDSGNPVKIGCVYVTASPTYTNNGRTDCRSTVGGAVYTSISSQTGGTQANVTQVTATANSQTTGVWTNSYQLLYNGATTDLELSAKDALNSTGAGVANANVVAQLDDTSPTAITENQFGNLRMTPNRALLVKPYASAAQDWTYAAASGGIVNTTTAVTLVGATASMRNYITACQISTDALGAATELAWRDGAGGTVLARIKLGTAALVLEPVVFPTPLKTTANTLLEVVTLTAVTGGVYVNCQGYVAP